MDKFEEFMYQYGRPDGRCPVIDLGDAIDQWPTIVITFGHLTAVVQGVGVGADGDQPHLSLDVHSFVDGLVARASVFGMEQGKRYHAFDDTAPGTSHGWPAVRGVTALIGQQTGRDDQVTLHTDPPSPPTTAEASWAHDATAPTDRPDDGPPSIDTTTTTTTTTSSAASVAGAIAATYEPK